MNKILLIVNPCAGQKKAKKYLAEIIEIFNRAGHAVTVHITSCKGDGEAAVLRYGDQVDKVVCCGGDGTFNETVSGVMKSGRDIPVGYIPCGSTNDFATSLHLHTDIFQATKVAAMGQPVKLDIGLFGERYFSYVASFGVFTRTSYSTPQSMKNVLGHAAYILNGIQELSQLHPHHLRFALSNGQVIEDDFLFGAVSNTTSVGGVLTLAQERVDMTDGKLELLLIRAPKSLVELSDCVWALQKKTYDSPLITFLSAAAMKVTAPADMGWTIDGEQETGHAEPEISCLHHAVRVIVDAEC